MSACSIKYSLLFLLFTGFSVAGHGYYVVTVKHFYNTLSEAHAACRADAGFITTNCDNTFAYHAYYHYVRPDGRYHRNVDGSSCSTSSTVYSYCENRRFYFSTVGCAELVPGSTTDPVTGQCIPPEKEEGESSCPEQTGGTNPINLAVGNKYQIETDYSGRQLSPLSVIRSFNSMSRAWRFFGEVILFNSNQAVVVRPDGKKLTFIADGTGGWFSDPDVTGVLESIDDGVGNITGWRYKTLAGHVEEYDSLGRVVSIRHRSGVSHSYVYAGSEITVTDSRGGNLVYQLDGSGRISGFVTPDNDQYSYSYDNYDFGRLVGMTYPNNGGSRVYHYEDSDAPHAITGITDANGERIATWSYDDQGKAISSQHNNSVDFVSVDYSNLADSVDPRTTVTNSLGKQTTYHFTTIHGVRKVTQVEGHQSTNCEAANKAYTYDTNGFLASKTDWKGNVTTYTRNAKGQELSRTEAFGTSEERTITTEWHTTFNLPTKITEPERETVITYVVNGNESSHVITAIAIP